MPKRIQRRRVKGWKMPKGAVNCTRPGRYSNPYRIGETYGGSYIVNAEVAVRAFKDDIVWNDRNALRMVNAGLTTLEIRQELRGCDLVCWCALDAEHCHVDTLLKIANAP